MAANTQQYASNGMFSGSLQLPTQQLVGHSTSGESHCHLLKQTLLKLRPTALSYGTSLTATIPHLRPLHHLRVASDVHFLSKKNPLLQR